MQTIALPADAAELLTPAQAANIVGMATRTLAAWRSLGRHSLPYLKVGGRVRYRRQDVEAWLNGRRHVSTTQLAQQVVQ